jgi:hypothetical protein
MLAGLRLSSLTQTTIDMTNNVHAGKCRASETVVMLAAAMASL